MPNRHLYSVSVTVLLLRTTFHKLATNFTPHPPLMAMLRPRPRQLIVRVIRVSDRQCPVVRLTLKTRFGGGPRWWRFGGGRFGGGPTPTRAAKGSDASSDIKLQCPRFSGHLGSITWTSLGATP